MAECSVSASQSYSFGPVRPVTISLPTLEIVRHRNRERLRIIRVSISGHIWGAQVIAAAAGKVTTVSYNSARGYFIVVDHGSGYVTLYQYLSRQDVAVGDVVYQGDQIGAVGDTGISTAPHLHFEIHVSGTPVDPLEYYK